jgi:hypothetical protein
VFGNDFEPFREKKTQIIGEKALGARRPNRNGGPEVNGFRAMVVGTLRVPSAPRGAVRCIQSAADGTRSVPDTCGFAALRHSGR